MKEEKGSLEGWNEHPGRKEGRKEMEMRRQGKEEERKGVEEGKKQGS